MELTAAALIAHIAPTAKSFADKAECDDWTDNSRRAAYVALIRSAKAWQAGENIVTVTVNTTARDTEVWGSVAGEILDAVLADFDCPASTQIADMGNGVAMARW